MSADKISTQAYGAFWSHGAGLDFHVPVIMCVQSPLAPPFQLFFVAKVTSSGVGCVTRCPLAALALDLAFAVLITSLQNQLIGVVLWAHSFLSVQR